jgi:hypothetical protein
MADGFFPELVSATRDANLVTNPIFVELTDGTNPVTSFTVTQATGSNLHVVVDAGAAVIGHVITDSGSTTAVTGNVTVIQGTGTNLHVNVDNFPSDSDALAQGSTTSGQLGSLVMGAVTTSAPSYTTGQTDPLSLTTAGALRTDSSATTQPVSGTVTANAGTGTFQENIAQYGGTATTLGQKAMAASMPVVIASDQSVLPVSFSIASVTGAVSDYATATVTANSSSNHDYTVVTSMKLTEVSFACSGGGKVELKVGPVASLVSKWVGFIPKDGGVISLVLNPPITVPTTSTGTVRLVMSNRENQSQDLYSTIIGVDA